MRTLYPIQVEINIYFSNEKGDTVVATYGCAAGKVPSEKEVKEALSETIKNLEEKGFSICNYDDFMNCIFEERIGTRGYAVPMQKDCIWWDENKY